MIREFFKKTRKNRAGLKRISEIAVINNLTDKVLTDEVNETICLIREFGGKKYDGLKKAKVNFYSKSQAASKYFKQKLDHGGILTVFLCNPGISGRDFNSKKEAVDFFEVKSYSAGRVFLYDTQKHNADLSMFHHYFFGTTFADTKAEMNSKYKLARNQQEILKEFSVKFEDKISEIKRALLDFHAKRKIVNSWSKNIFTLACIKSEEHNAIVRPIAHMVKGIDVLFHRRHRKGGNFISFSPKAEKLLPALLSELDKREKVLEFGKVKKGWFITGNIIHTCHGSRTEMTFDEVFAVIEKVASTIEPKKEVYASALQLQTA